MTIRPPERIKHHYKKQTEKVEKLIREWNKIKQPKGKKK